ncbi:MAG: GNAT family N-acetyltransferase [Christensenella sp.]|uniref:GNAT family N-acetyltransferase n=1 Tax=Christensenella sp. TaxID=1935934 RepID=UPI002B1FAB47|nr:GNAT family N-acetyltransferase [Christensenella sp.]MEA5002168.1 GNAT family N-acetyltransferase [Christensenella sp.]
MFFKEYHSTEDPEWSLLWDLYCKSFPAHEKRSLDDHRKAMDDPAFTCTGIWDEDGFVGLLFYWTYTDGHYIEFFAISETRRGMQCGSRCLQAFLEKHPVVILEIEMPVTNIARRRKRFYERLGFVASHQEHLHPAYTKDAAPYHLMILRYPKACSDAQYGTFYNFFSTRVMRYSEKFDSTL